MVRNIIQFLDGSFHLKFGIPRSCQLFTSVSSRKTYPMLGMLDCALEAPELWEQLPLRTHPASEAQPFRVNVAVNPQRASSSDAMCGTEWKDGVRWPCDTRVPQLFLAAVSSVKGSSGCREWTPGSEASSLLPAHSSGAVAEAVHFSVSHFLAGLITKSPESIQRFRFLHCSLPAGSSSTQAHT